MEGHVAMLGKQQNFIFMCVAETRMYRQAYPQYDQPSSSSILVLLMMGPPIASDDHYAPKPSEAMREVK